MALSPGRSGTADPIEAEYFTQQTADDSAVVHMHLDAVDGIARDVVEGVRVLPRRGVEVGGLLLGHVESGERPTIWIDRYQRLECQHRFGPQFALDDDDLARLEKAAEGIYDSGDLHVVGFYRSHTHSGFQLEEYDFELIGRYFSDSADLILLIKPESMVDIRAQFFARDGSGEVRAAGAIFPFRGRVVGSLAGDSPADPADDPERTAKTNGLAGRQSNGQITAAANADPPTPGEVAEGPLIDPASIDPASITPASTAAVNEPGPKIADPKAVPDASVPRETFRRLVPDFAPLEEQRRQARAFMSENLAAQARPTPALPKDEPRPSSGGALLRQWWPLLAAILLVVGAVWLLLPRTARRETPAVRVAPETASTEPGTPVRPLGLYVDPSGQTWRISWNPGATAFRGARSVELFVRDGEDQNRIPLTQQDLQTGTYQYAAKGQDVTFRLEVTDTGGHLSAESFRLLKVAPAAEPEKPVEAVERSSADAPQPVSSRNSARPRATHKVPPVVPAGIRPRIRAPIPIDIRVRVDSHGRVTEATPVSKQHTGLETYLVGRAVSAARQWRFEPAREGGKAVPGTETIHFVFER
jgi:hypothetical protein